MLNNNGSLCTFDPKHSICKTVYKSEKNIQSFNVDMNGTLIWIEKNATTIGSSPQKLSNIPYSEKWNVTAMAIDFITEKLYIVDENAETLNLIDLQFNHTAIVLSNLKQPHDIVLDPIFGLMFIVQLKHSVIELNLLIYWLPSLLLTNAHICKKSLQVFFEYRLM